MLLFKETNSPKRHQRFSKKNKIRWLTWSDCFLKDQKLIADQIARIDDTDFTFLKKYKNYNYSYTVGLKKLDKDFKAYFRNYAYSLYHFGPDRHIVFFRDLIGKRLNTKHFHFIFSLLRDFIVDINADKMGALYSPLQPGKKESEFPLHCDLYIPKILFNVMNKVTKDKTGHSTFLQTKELYETILPQVKSMDKPTKKLLKILITEDVREDNYDRFYTRLYNVKWQDEVRALMDANQLRIRLKKGEGYMLHDRIWMHGRDKTSGGVSQKRLHRLIFNNFYTANSNSF